MPSPEAFEAAVRRHDTRLAALRQVVWVGSEPTFTDRFSQAPEWLSQALGGAKEPRAQALLARLCRRQPGALMVRCIGRQYPGEPLPRWNLGLYRRRDGVALWGGPQDPLLGTTPADGDAAADAATDADLDAWATAMAAEFQAQGWQVTALPAKGDAQRRLVLHAADATDALDPDDPRLWRPSVHTQAVPASGLRDELAESGLHLFVLNRHDTGAAPGIEWPLFTTVPMFLAALACVERACTHCALPALRMAGFSPPVDDTVEFTTVTPDPAVVEVNTAPSPDALGFLQRSREIYAAAADEGLAPYRLYFTGVVADSGGGGQITLGGPSPQSSPFVLEPQLLPRLVRHFNRHPALSYLFAHDYLGSSGQSVRADERGQDAFDELNLALTLLQRQVSLSPQLMWHSLAPFLSDVAGNSHRAEINIEKLWNPFLAGRGKLGLVEFRALRMQHTPERATALACLLRALVAMLVARPQAPPLIDWGRELHERFALPFYLQQDLLAVLHDLDAAGLGLDDAIRALLLRDEFRLCAELALPGCTLEVWRAIEFWPLLGDAASPEQGGTSRLVDASTARIELRLRPAEVVEPGDGDWADWQVHSGGALLPMRPEQDELGALKVYGLRYRSFVPTWGLHPALGAQTPVSLLLRHPAQDIDHGVTLHEWPPAGEAYDGLPQDLAEARRRRAERAVVQVVPRTAAAATPARAALAGPYCLDLRVLG
jgi:uncharacterized protein (DUF2126 family)